MHGKFTVHSSNRTLPWKNSKPLQTCCPNCVFNYFQFVFKIVSKNKFAFWWIIGSVSIIPDKPNRIHYCWIECCRLSTNQPGIQSINRNHLYSITPRLKVQKTFGLCLDIENHAYALIFWLHHLILKSQAFALFLFSRIEASLRAAWASFSFPSAKSAAACKYAAICQTGDITWACDASLRASCGVSLMR